MLIGLCGKAGSGKDTVGIMLAKHGYTTYAMATPLKAMLAAAGFKEPTRELKEIQIPGFDFSYRKAAQMLGTEWGRQVDENLWLKLAKRHIEASQMPTVITDVRFVNEAEMILSLGGILVHVVGRSADLGTCSGHASEVGIPESYMDWVIHNESTLEHLEVLVGMLAFDVELLKAAE